MDRHPSTNNDPLAFKSHVLYLLLNDRSSKKAASIARNHDNIFIQDVDQLKRRPPWLRGVPTLVHLDSKKPWCGSKALVELKRICKVPTGLSTSTMDGIGFALDLGDSPLGGPVHPTGVGLFKSSGVDNVHYATDRKLKETDIEACRKGRSSQMKRSAAVQPTNKRLDPEQPMKCTF